MPIPQEDLNAKWILVAANETVGVVLARLPSDRATRAFLYVLLPAAHGRYIVVQWVEIEHIATQIGQDIRGLRLDAIPGLPEPVEAVERDSMGINAAREQRDAQPGKRLVVLANSQPVGLLTIETLAGETLGADPFAPAPRRPVVLGIDDEATQSAAPPAAAPEESQADNRVINGWVEGLESTEALQLKHVYELRLDVDAPRADARLRVEGVNTLVQQLAAGQELLEILVVLEPGDFTLYGLDQQLIVVPRVGKSKNTALFAIEPKKKGANTLNVLFYVNNRVFQKIAMTFQVGRAASANKTVVVKATGVALPSALAQPPRERGQPVNVMIIKKEEGFQFVVQGGGVARALLRVTEAQTADWIRYARQELKNIIYKMVDNQYVYQDENTTIPPKIHTESLKALAKVGFSLFDGLFFSNNGPDAQAMGRLLSELSQKRQLNIQVAGDRFFFPWALLYDRDSPDNVDTQGFWGFKHIIEYTPEFSQPSPVSFDPNILVGDTLDIGFVCNNAIDTQFSRPILADQRAFFKSLPGVSVKDYPNVADLASLLLDTNAPQLIYMYCHAVSKFPNEDGGVDDSTLGLTDAKVTLRELKLAASTRRPILARAPLVFLNACQSAELSPYLYDGLVPYLIARGVRGVLGTEVDTPALFGAEFAKEFLKRFVAGDRPLGELLLELRREYLEQKNNVSGLVYALYSSGDVVVRREA